MQNQTKPRGYGFVEYEKERDMHSEYLLSYGSYVLVPGWCMRVKTFSSNYVSVSEKRDIFRIYVALFELLV